MDGGFVTPVVLGDVKKFDLKHAILEKLGSVVVPVSKSIHTQTGVRVLLS